MSSGCGVNNGGKGMKWRITNRADPAAAAIADRHYSRQSHGSRQFVPPGRCLVLVTKDYRALWVTSWPLAQYVGHAWAGAWTCSLFRNEGAGLSSELINQAVAATRWYCSFGPSSWTACPEPALGMITFVKPTAIRSSNPGYCYQRAGWRKVGHSKELNLPCLQILTSDMPAPEQPGGTTMQLFRC